MTRSRVVSTLLALAAFATLAGAEEWYESYRRGVRALAQGRPDQAVTLLERAAAQRPEPGRNVVTYGTNVEREYSPYLRLAEASLQLRDAARARSALERSEKWAREPADQRQRLWARLEELTPKPIAAPASPVAPAPPATAPPPATTASQATLPPASVPAPLPSAEPQAPATRHPPGTAAAGPEPTLPAAAPTLEPPPAPAGTASLEVLSQPPGASVYVDDELAGTTDPEWGRLIRGGLPPGRHRVRLSLAGHDDVMGEVDLEAGARGDFRRRLTPAAPPDRRPILYGAIAVLVLLCVALWGWRGFTAERAPSSIGLAPTPRPSHGTPPPVRGTPPGMGSPGVTRDAAGREHFGEYLLLEPLGRGGMASVWKAERDAEVVALKRPLSAFLEEPEFLERFVREADIGRTLHHPNVIRVLERGEVEGVPFLSMELLPGETLQSRIERHGALPARDAASVVVQIAEALDYAHSKGVVHRDLKPSNVMLLPDGTAKVMDFGIARARRFEGLTVTGAFLGSPDYIAPEAIEGGETDARSDLYSLGVTFYEALTGRRPFSADTPFAVLRKHLTETPVRPSVLKPDVPPQLEAMVLRLLSKAPSDRIASAEDLVRDLRDYLNRAA